jgi:CheY-like chemotaxis protein
MPQGVQQGRILVTASGGDGSTAALVDLVSRCGPGPGPLPEVSVVALDEIGVGLTAPDVALLVVDARGPSRSWRAAVTRLAARPTGAPDDPPAAVPVLLVASAGSEEEATTALDDLPVADILRLPCRDAEARARLRALTAAGRAREEERRRLATAIHDDALQVLASVALRLQMMRRAGGVGGTAGAGDPDSPGPALDDVVDDLGAALERLRTLEFERREPDEAVPAASGGPGPGGTPHGDDAGDGRARPVPLWSTPETLRRMGHDLRSPLNAVLGFAQLLDLADLEPDQRDAVAQILQAGTRLVDLINDLIELARIEAGIIELAPRPLSPADQVRTVLATARLAADAGRVTLVPPEAETEPGPPATAPGTRLLADPDRVTQILTAMVGHAVQACPPGGRVTVGLSAGPAGAVRITVHHDHAEPAAEDVHGLLVAFARPSPQPGTPGPRSLALPIAAALARSMGGRLIAEASGDRVALMLELAGEPPPADALPDDDRPLFEVLYIEDNPSSLRLVERVLHRRRGVAMIAASDGRTGVDLARRRHPALVLVDLHLPDMNGTDVLRALTRDPATCDIPVVALSAGARRDQDERLRAEGARAYLSKPFEIDELLGLVDTFRLEREAGRPEREAGRPEPPADRYGPAGLVARPGTSVVASSDVAVAEERR